MDIKELYIIFRGEVIKDDPEKMNYENLQLLKHVREFVNWVDRGNHEKKINAENVI